ncbi:hypothetical protein, partial [Spirochaeta cellobiosiphila]|uniref:hypothetical protein n=1 Tax=Spirochaeta cellobiosiphila TaxID=504483 RepID=UPI001B7FB088
RIPKIIRNTTGKVPVRYRHNEPTIGKGDPFYYRMGAQHYYWEGHRQADCLLQPGRVPLSLLLKASLR